MENQELKEWSVLYKQFKNGYHLSNTDKQDLLRLNHLLMEECHNVHNSNMMDK